MFVPGKRAARRKFQADEGVRKKQQDWAEAPLSPSYAGAL
jgi:hypothetical protein